MIQKYLFANNMLKIVLTLYCQNKRTGKSENSGMIWNDNDLLDIKYT